MVFSRGCRPRQPVPLLDDFRYSFSALSVHYNRLWRVYQSEDFEGVEKECGSLPPADKALYSMRYLAYCGLLYLSEDFRSLVDGLFQHPQTSIRCNASLQEGLARASGQWYTWGVCSAGRIMVGGTANGQALEATEEFTKGSCFCREPAASSAPRRTSRLNGAHGGLLVDCWEQLNREWY